MTRAQNIVFLHQNMPGQFKHLAPWLAARGHRVAFVTKRDGVDLPGVRRVSYPAPRGSSATTHHYLHRFEDAVRHGQAVVRALRTLADEGFVPDTIVAHTGWGEPMFVREIHPRARLIGYCEFYYAGTGQDLGFDPESPATFNAICRARARNAHLLMGLENCDVAVSPTAWQKSVHPAALRDKIRVIFDGIDVDRVRPSDAATIELADGRRLTRTDKVVTYVGRNLEPYRGFRTFMRALPALQRACPDAEVVIIGGDEVSYGSKPDGFANWREAMQAEVDYDASRVHFLGRLPYGRYLDALRVSSAHVYLTYPFVLSWSCVEAMAAGALVIGSNTAPVRELISDGENGILVDFFDHEALAQRIAAAIAAPDRHAHLRAAARATIIEHYAMAPCLQQWTALIESPGLFSGRPARRFVVTPRR